MRFNNTELKLVVDLFCDMRKDVTISVNGRMFFNLISSCERKKIDLENNRLLLNINNGKLSIEDEYDIFGTLVRLDANLFKSNVADFLWLNCLEFNNTLIEGYSSDKANCIQEILLEYMSFKRCKCLDIYSSIDYKNYNLVLFSDGTLYREYMDIDTDPNVPMLLIFEMTLCDMFERTPGIRLLGTSCNYEVATKENYLKQLARVSRNVKFKFKVVKGN